VFDEGKAITAYPLRVIYLIHSSSTQNLQAGFTVSSRTFKRAVDRNRIKRLLRESYRLQKEELETLMKETNRQLAVFWIFTGKEIADHSLISSKMMLLMNKIIKQIE
jgi:ribonuclease P protein component